MDFLKDIFQIVIRENEDAKYPLPNYIRSRYKVKNAVLAGIKIFLLYPKTELESPVVIKKHIQKMQSFEKIPVVLMLSNITIREREGMLKTNISFIVDNKQCFLPFLGTILTERCDVKNVDVKKLLPSAQVLLFYYIYNGKRELIASEAGKNMNVSAMIVTRAVRQLQQCGLIKSYKKGVLKIIKSDFSFEELFNKASPYLSNPIKKSIYIPKDKVDADLLYAGDLALSHNSMLNPPQIKCFATDDEKNGSR